MTGKCGICVCLAADTISADLRLAHENRAEADLFELRADCLSHGEMSRAADFPSEVDRPVILTIRRSRDGGGFSGTEAERVGVMRALLRGAFASIDLEADLEAPDLEALAASRGTRIIRSLHVMDGVPADLGRRLENLGRTSREVPKVAVWPRGCADLARLVGVFKETQGREKILLGMGDYGLPTTLLAPLLGSAICYAQPGGPSAAPGQVGPRTLTDTYRFREIGPETEVFGVMGNPIGHSLSPLIHNRGFAALRLPAVYVPFLVDDLASFFKAADSLGVRGLSVTVPHKEAVLPFIAHPDGLVGVMGAANTLVRDPHTGEWAGTNTDAEGFLSPLRDALGGSIPRGLRATVIGAGGASRAVVHALVGAGAKVLVLNRDPSRARALARAFPVRWAPLDEAGAALMADHADLVVQATSVGMESAGAARAGRDAPGGGAAGRDPVPWYAFTGKEIAFDLVYRPAETQFLRRAREAGCTAIPGRRMLLAQAMAQFRLFTGSVYPAGLAEEIDLVLAASTGV